MGRLGVDDLEDLHGLRLDADGRAELLTTQTECTFGFLGDDGPRGVIMSFLYAEGAFWVTAVRGRAHVDCLDADDRVSIVVSSIGTTLAGRRMVAVRGTAEVHDDRETLDWFLPRFAAQLKAANPSEFIRLLDSPRRVVMKVVPEAITASHDSRRMPGDGRGGKGKA